MFMYAYETARFLIEEVEKSFVFLSLCINVPFTISASLGDGRGLKPGRVPTSLFHCVFIVVN